MTSLGRRAAVPVDVIHYAEILRAEAPSSRGARTDSSHQQGHRPQLATAPSSVPLRRSTSRLRIRLRHLRGQGVPRPGAQQIEYLSDVADRVGGPAHPVAEHRRPPSAKHDLEHYSLYRPEAQSLGLLAGASPTTSPTSDRDPTTSQPASARSQDPLVTEI